MLCWKISFSLAPIVLVSRRVRLPVRDLSSASQLTFCSFILTWSVSTSKLMFIHYSELKMGSKIIQKNYLLKLFLISDTAPNLNLVPARSGRDRNAQTCSFSDKNQPVFVFVLVFLSHKFCVDWFWGFTSDLETVGWMNARRAADAQFNKCMVNK